MSTRFIQQKTAKLQSKHRAKLLSYRGNPIEPSWDWSLNNQQMQSHQLSGQLAALKQQFVKNLPGSYSQQQGGSLDSKKLQFASRNKEQKSNCAKQQRLSPLCSTRQNTHDSKQNQILQDLVIDKLPSTPQSRPAHLEYFKNNQSVKRRKQNSKIIFPGKIGTNTADFSKQMKRFRSTDIQDKQNPMQHYFEKIRNFQTDEKSRHSQRKTMQIGSKAKQLISLQALKINGRQRQFMSCSPISHPPITESKSTTNVGQWLTSNSTKIFRRSRRAISLDQGQDTSKKAQQGAEAFYESDKQTPVKHNPGDQIAQILENEKLLPIPQVNPKLALTHRPRFSQKYLSIPALNRGGQKPEPSTNNSGKVDRPKSRKQQRVNLESNKHTSSVSNSRNQLKPPKMQQFEVRKTAAAATEIKGKQVATKASIVIPKNLIQFNPKSAALQNPTQTGDKHSMQQNGLAAKDQSAVKEQHQKLQTIQRAVIRKVYMKKSQELMQQVSSESKKQINDIKRLRAHKKLSDPISRDNAQREVMEYKQKLQRIETISEHLDENSLTFIVNQQTAEDKEEFEDNFSLQSGISSILQIDKDHQFRQSDAGSVKDEIMLLKEELKLTSLVPSSSINSLPNSARFNNPIQYASGEYIVKDPITSKATTFGEQKDQIIRSKKLNLRKKQELPSFNDSSLKEIQFVLSPIPASAQSKKESQVSLMKKEQIQGFQNSKIAVTKNCERSYCDSKSADSRVNLESEQSQKKGLLGSIFQYRQKLENASKLFSEQSQKVSSVKQENEMTHNSNFPLSQVSLSYSRNTTLQGGLKNGSQAYASKRRSLSETSITQQNIVLNETTNKTAIADDDFFNLNGPSDVRKQQFDNYDMFYRQQSELEKSYSILSRNVSTKLITQDNLPEGRGPQQQRSKLNKVNYQIIEMEHDFGTNKQGTAVWQADDITVAIQGMQKSSQGQLSNNNFLKSTPRLPTNLKKEHKENSDDLRLTLTSQSDQYYKDLGQGNQSSSQNLMRLRNTVFSPPIRNYN